MNMRAKTFKIHSRVFKILFYITLGFASVFGAVLLSQLFVNLGAWREIVPRVGLAFLPPFLLGILSDTLGHLAMNKEERKKADAQFREEVERAHAAKEKKKEAQA